MISLFCIFQFLFLVYGLCEALPSKKKKAKKYTSKKYYKKYKRIFY